MRGENTEQRNSQIRPVQLINESTGYNIWAIPCVSGRSNSVHKCVTVLSFLLLNWKQRQSWIFLWQLWNRRQCRPHSQQRTHSRTSYRIKAKAFTRLPIVSLHSPKDFHYGEISCHLSTELHNIERKHRKVTYQEVHSIPLLIWMWSMNKMDLYKCPAHPSFFYTAKRSLIFNTNQLLTKSENLTT